MHRQSHLELHPGRLWDVDLESGDSSLSVVQARGFGAEQTAHLIRALFEHTDFRSAVLAEVEQ